MADDTDWKRTIEMGEAKNIDFKDAMPWDRDSRDKLTAAIVALANSRDGGNLLIGVTEKTPDRAPAVVGVSDDSARTYDPSPIGEHLANHFQPAHHVRIQRVELEGKTIVVIVVPEFTSAPLVCTKQSGTYRDAARTKLWFKPGEVLIRSVAAQSRPVQTGDEMHELLRLALTKTKEALLADMRRVLEGERVMPVAAAPGIVAAKDWAAPVAEFRNTLGTANMTGTFEFECVFPSAIAPPDDYHELLRLALTRARVDPRSWGDIPFDPQYDQLRNQDGCVSIDRTDVNKWSGYQHIARLNVSGFVGYAEDRPEADPAWAKERLKDLEGQRALLWVRTAARTATALIFLGRLCEELQVQGSVQLLLRWTSLRDTTLYLDNGFFRDLRFKCVDSEVTHQEIVSAIDLKTAPGERMRAALNRLLTMYQVDLASRRAMVEAQVREQLPTRAAVHPGL